MEDVGEVDRRIVERPDVAGVQSHGAVPDDVWGDIGEASRVPGQQDGLGPEAQLIVRLEEALQHPASEEAGAARHEQPATAEVLPEALGVLQDVLQVPLRQRPVATPRHRYGLRSALRRGREAGRLALPASAAGH